MKWQNHSLNAKIITLFDKPEVKEYLTSMYHPFLSGFNSETKV